MAPQGPASAFESETFGQDASFRLEQPVGSMSISPSGRDVALASKEGLHIIDLDSPYSPPRYLPHRTPWEVADVQWSPFAARDYWIISTSNQKALVWNLEARSWQDCIEFVLHGHTRAITDINFSAHNPDVLATCAVDSFVHCWDLRAPLRPVNSFSDWFAGATQVKWSRQDEHVIASSHDKFLHIWDARNGAYPVKTIEAHGTKIYGVDWNRYQPQKIVTCSLDKTIKFWDFDNPEDLPERIIETPFPVWRARHTPFGWGLLAMPQRGNSDLHLYDRRAMNGVLESGPVRPVATFAGHEGQVKEFLWRPRGTIVDGVDHRDFQLVTWGTDRELRLHALDSEVYADIGYEKGVSKVQRLNFTRKGAVYRTFRDEPGDTDSLLSEPTPRSENFLRSSHNLQFRARVSTNVGMSKVPVSQFRGWVQGGRHAHRSGMHGRGNHRQSADPIAWLKNVKISSWDPDALAEEIRQVGEKFKNVDFEAVDISRRKAVMSLQAPWGEDQSQVYLRVEMRFPKLYPRNANAVLSLHKSGFVDDSTHNIITTGLHTISETYASRKRGCLEAVLRYLLREQNLEQIVAWVLGESLTESKVLDTGTPIPVDDSSSDDDDQLDGVRDGLDASANILVPLAKGCGALWSETGKLVCFFPAKGKEPVSFLSTLGVRDLEDSESSRLFEGFGRLHASSPARKATSGTKTADDDSGSETSDSSWKSSSGSSSSFETEQNVRGVPSYRAGVSGLQQRSRSPDRSNHSTTGINKLTEVPRKSVVSIHDFVDLIPSKRELAVEYKIFGNGQEVCKHNANVARNASLNDLASAWTLLGLVLDDAVPLEVVPDLSQTAADDISIIARAAARIPRRDHGVTDLKSDKALGRTRWGNHPLGSTYLLPAIFDHFERLGDVQMLAMMSCVFASVLNVRLGDFVAESLTSPSNDGSLIRSDYFPSKAVAKSFLQSEVAPEGYVLIDSINVHPNPTMHTSASGPTLHSQRRTFNSLSRQGSQLSSRAAGFVADDSMDQASPYSTTIPVSTSPEGNQPSHRTTSSIVYSSARASLSALTQSYSNSPPNQSSASGFASSFKKYSPSGSLAPGWVSSGIFGGTQSGGSNQSSRMSFHSTSEAASQDSHDICMRTSFPSSALRTSHKDRIAAQSGTSRRTVKPVTASDVSEHTQQEKKPGKKRKGFKTHLFNQDKFDLDGYSSSPLLDPVLDSKCRIYRACYASILDVWQLYMQRAEILKFDGLVAETNIGSSHPLASVPGPPQPHLPGRPRRKTLISASRGTSPSLHIRRCCRACGEPLEPIEKNNIPIGWHCVNIECTASTSFSSGSSAFKVPKRSVCAICNTSVQGLAVPCLSCGHLSCYECARGWFGKKSGKKLESRRLSDETVQPSSPTDYGENDSKIDVDVELCPDTGMTNEHNTCPTGCGCPCALLSSIPVPYPPSLLDELEPEGNPLPTNTPAVLQRNYAHILGLTSASNIDSGSDTGIHRSASFLAPSSSDTASLAGIVGGTGTDKALSAFLALTQAHQRSKSVTTTATTNATTSSNPNPTAQGRPSVPTTADVHNANGAGIAVDEDTTTDVPPTSSGTGPEDEMPNPWTNIKLPPTTLGRGIGGGLSRGLSSKASNATIRRVK
ncbi:uncharacterized protein Z518_01170 [Rhinocladiella mackenziei CBS 650.93]|uniref:WD repeat protein n=1 Tax=Rhinocladiella mackenziei CBS 650.93 TaxID=1442369 RepID=A0A0D2IVM8_9EURO|nr:uncharacterized protein Z518_01170 [Rhinocladiella mackenziei CBS 650.93]KIX10089.1 hypothetical protein Z518_01170 [Rhinocladiella mackenziei CBS 650.93]